MFANFANLGPAGLPTRGQAPATAHCSGFRPDNDPVTGFSLDLTDSLLDLTDSLLDLTGINRHSAKDFSFPADSTEMRIFAGILRRAGVVCLFAVARLVTAADFVVDDDYDGISPATACIQPGGASFFAAYGPAVTAANTGGGPHTIHICPGVYTSTGALNSANFIGLTIQGTSGNPADVRMNPLGGNETFDLRRPGITLQHLTAVGGGNDGIELRNATGALVNNVVVTGAGRRGVLFINADTAVLSNSSVINSNNEGILVNRTSNAVRILSSDVAGGTDCIEVDGTNAVLSSISVMNCNDEGVQIDGNGVQIDSASVGPAINDIGLFVNSLNARVTNTSVTGAPNDDGMQLGGRSDNAVVDQLRIGGVGSEGLLVTGGARDVTASNVTIDGAVECIEIDGPNAVFTDITVTNYSNDGIRIDGTRLQLTTATIGPAIGDIGLLLNRARAVVTDVDIVDAANDGVNVTRRGDNSTFTNTSVQTVIDEGIVVARGGNNVRFDTATVTDAGDQCVQFSGNNNRLQDAGLTNCGDIGLYIAGTNNTAERVRISLTGQYGVLTRIVHK